jgi:hypothetical protein
MPAAQYWPDVHFTPHAPQFAVSFATSVHVLFAPHGCIDPGHVFTTSGVPASGIGAGPLSWSSIGVACAHPNKTDAKPTNKEKRMIPSTPKYSR